MALTPGTYTQGSAVSDAETGWGDSSADSKTGGPYFQDAVISPVTVADGTLRQRFDLKCYPQKGITALGTDSDGAAAPATAKTVYGATSH
jgi:hypothetical protein